MNNRNDVLVLARGSKMTVYINGVRINKVKTLDLVTEYGEPPAVQFTIHVDKHLVRQIEAGDCEDTIARTYFGKVDPPINLSSPNCPACGASMYHFLEKPPVCTNPVCSMYKPFASGGYFTEPCRARFGEAGPDTRMVRHPYYNALQKIRSRAQMSTKYAFTETAHLAKVIVGMCDEAMSPFAGIPFPGAPKQFSEEEIKAAFGFHALTVDEARLLVLTGHRSHNWYRENFK